VELTKTMNELRCRRLIERAIEATSLDLRGLTVLTEAASGCYILTPLIAAIAGGQVYTLARDSRYGSAADIVWRTEELALRWGVGFTHLPNREDVRIGAADIVTNLGFVRPLDAPFLSRLKRTAVIPLMWESWEFREEDLNLPECRRLGIPVLGTNEHVAALRIFEYIGHLCVKLLYLLDIEVFRSRVVVVGDGEFGDNTEQTLSNAGALVTRVLPGRNGGLGSAEALQAIRQADALAMVEYHTREMLIGDGGQMSADRLHSLNPALVLAHVCGTVDAAALDRAGICYLPERLGSPGFMSVTTGYAGPRPLIDLNTGGLKVGESMARARLRGLTAAEAEIAAQQETPLAQAFPPDILRRLGLE
jgi:hypothetical protein